MVLVFFFNLHLYIMFHLELLVHHPQHHKLVRAIQQQQNHPLLYQLQVKISVVQQQQMRKTQQ